MARVKTPPLQFWLTCLAGLVWYVVAFGNAYFLWVVYEYSTNPFPIPSAYIAIVALNVVGGLLGYILLMLNKKLSITLFNICLLASFAQVLYVNNAEYEISYFGWAPDYIQPFLIVTVAMISMGFSRFCKNKGWIS